MIRSGIVPIDKLCGGIRPRSTYLLTGGAGSGKTGCCLQFVNQGLRCGESILMVSHASREELLGYANLLGVDLGVALREERAVVLRYRTDFARRVAQAGTTERVFDELRGLLSKYRPRRVVIDTFGPFLDDGSPSPLPAASLAEMLERSQATSLLTYPSDLAASYDRRLEPLVQSAAGIFRLALDTAGVRWVEVVSLRYPALEAAALRAEMAALPRSGGAARRSLEPLELR
jgi:KaiC/GvpD/RAD55 family RecA-like ATPase